jgi:uncharacterized protein involved in response to NO
MKVSITEKEELRKFAGTALFNLGFRPFFLGAGVYSIIAMLLWWLQYSGLNPIELTPAWHAHEMIFGYTLAVIAGFLLTSVRNWTGLDTVTGLWLFLLFSMWVAARVFNTMGLYWAAAANDIGFMLYFGWCAVVPIVKVKQWRQTAVVAVIIVLIIANSLYYAGQLGFLADGVYLGIYLGFYFVLGLILVMAGRVVPFFIERGVDEDVTFSNNPWMERLNFACFLIFVLLSLFGSRLGVSSDFHSMITGVLFVLNAIRLASWYTNGIWQKPLLWSLYIAYGFIVLGFLLHSLLFLGWFNVFIPIHAIAVGGVGFLTLSMMARVSLGHSGRSINEPSKLIVLAFPILILTAVVRIFMPLLFPESYLLWIWVSQILWITAFSLFVIVYLPVLVQPRTDGRAG